MRILFLSFWILLSFAACKPVAEVSPNLRVQLGGVPATLDPAKAEEGAALHILATVMEGAVRYDGAGRLQNALCDSIQVSPDRKKYVFTLRPEAKWSDGKPVTAQDFILGFRRALAPATASKLAEAFVVIRGGLDYRRGKSTELPGVREESGRLVVELERPISYFLQLMTLGGAMPARQDILDSHGGNWPDGKQIAEGPATGPYRIASYLPDQKIILERNPYYWGPQPKIEKVEFVIVSDEATGVNLFDQGKLDILSKVPSLNFQRWKKEGKVRTEPYLATYYLGFNCRKPPFSDRDFRRAVSASIDRQGIVDALMTGEIPARSWVPKGLEGYRSFEESSKAADAIAAPSIVKVKAQASALKPLVLSFDSGERNTLIAEKVEQDLKRKLGLHISLSNLDWKSHLKTVQTDAPPFFRLAWQTPFLDPIFHLQVMMSAHPANPTGCGSADYDRLVGEIENLSPGPERERKIHEAQEILTEKEVFLAPIYHYVQNHAVSPRVMNFHTNPFGVIRFDELEINHANGQ